MATIVLFLFFCLVAGKHYSTVPVNVLYYHVIANNLIYTKFKFTWSLWNHVIVYYWLPFYNFHLFLEIIIF